MVEHRVDIGSLEKVMTGLVNASFYSLYFFRKKSLENLSCHQSSRLLESLKEAGL